MPRLHSPRLHLPRLHSPRLRSPRLPSPRLRGGRPRRRLLTRPLAAREPAWAKPSSSGTFGGRASSTCRGRAAITHCRRVERPVRCMRPCASPPPSPTIQAPSEVTDRRARPASCATSLCRSCGGAWLRLSMRRRARMPSLRGPCSCLGHALVLRASFCAACTTTQRMMHQ